MQFICLAYTKLWVQSAALQQNKTLPPSQKSPKRKQKKQKKKIKQDNSQN